MSRAPMKAGDDAIAVPDEQVLIYQQCACCRQNMPLDQFDTRGRWRENSKKTDTICKGCREIQAKETRKFVRRNAKRVDDMMLNLVEALAEEPCDEWDELPDIGTLTQALLRPFGGAKGLGLQIASSYLASPPGSPCRQKTHALLVKLDVEASKLGYAKKPVELMSDEELELYLQEKQRRLLKQADGEDETQIQEATSAGSA